MCTSSHHRHSSECQRTNCSRLSQRGIIQGRRRNRPSHRYGVRPWRALPVVHRLTQPITDARSGNERGVRRQRMAARPCQPATKCLGASRRVDGDTAPTGGAAVTALHSVATAMRAALAWAHEVFCERDGASSTGTLTRQRGGKDRPRTRNHGTMSLGEVATQACRTSLWREMDA